MLPAGAVCDPVRRGPIPGDCRVPATASAGCTGVPAVGDWPGPLSTLRRTSPETCPSLSGQALGVITGGMCSAPALSMSLGGHRLPGTAAGEACWREGERTWSLAPASSPKPSPSRPEDFMCSPRSQGEEERRRKIRSEA